MRGRLLVLGVCALGGLGAIASACSGFSSSESDAPDGGDGSAVSGEDGSPLPTDGATPISDSAADTGWVLGSILEPNEAGLPVCTSDAGAGGPKRVFVTVREVPGGFGGVPFGDAICATEAEAAGIGDCWKAWLSTNVIAARDRIGAGPWYRLDRSTFVVQPVENKEAGLDAPFWVKNTIATDANGDAAAGRAWTGAGAGGVVTNQHCVGWTSSLSDPDGGPVGRTGDVTARGSTWTSAGEENAVLCGVRNHLYCFEQ